MIDLHFHDPTERWSARNALLITLEADDATPGHQSKLVEAAQVCGVIRLKVGLTQISRDSFIDHLSTLMVDLPPADRSSFARRRKAGGEVKELRPDQVFISGPALECRDMARTVSDVWPEVDIGIIRSGAEPHGAPSDNAVPRAGAPSSPSVEEVLVGWGRQDNPDIRAHITRIIIEIKRGTP